MPAGECPACKANREAAEIAKREAAEATTQLEAVKAAADRAEAELKAEKAKPPKVETKIETKVEEKPVIVSPSEAAAHYDSCPECKPKWEALLQARAPKQDPSPVTPAKVPMLRVRHG